MSARLLVSIVVMLTLVGCGGAPAGPARVVSLTVTGSGGAPSPGLTVRFTATLHFSDSSTEDVTSQAAWHSSSPEVAAVSSPGLVTAAAVGITEIRATYLNASGAVPLRVIVPSGPFRP